MQQGVIKKSNLSLLIDSILKNNKVFAPVKQNFGFSVSEIKSAIPDEIIRSRARHVISENDRVLRAIPALKNGNLDLFGQLMNESHDSLKTDYEVTGFELDTMAEEAQKLSGVIGSRMTGAGFGGCTVSLVDQDQIDGFIDKLGKTYSEKTNLQADFYVADVGNGVCELFL